MGDVEKPKLECQDQEGEGRHTTPLPMSLGKHAGSSRGADMERKWRDGKRDTDNEDPTAGA